MWCKFIEFRVCFVSAEFPEEASLILQKNLKFLRSESSQMFNIPKPNYPIVGITLQDTSRQGKDISECRTSNRELVSSTSKPWRRAQAFAEPSNGKLNECLEDSTVISHAPDRSTGQVHISLKLEIFNSRSSSSTAVEARCDYEFLEQNSDRLIQSNDTHQFQCRSMNFIDLTEDEDPALQRLGGKNHSHENTETQRKRKRSHAVAAEEAMARCPVCNDLFPPHV